MRRGGQPDRSRLLADERRRIELPRHGKLRIGIGYPNTYHVAQSSLAFQWVTELAGQSAEVGVERCYADPALVGTTLESCSPISDLDLLAWSCSFEPDAVGLLQTLARAGIPWCRQERGHRFPLLVLGGAVASINPLPLAPAIDVFCLGPAELLLPLLLQQMLSQPDRDLLLEDLADRDGFFVPRHHLDRHGRPLRRLRRVQLRDPEAAVPASHLVTPHTEYSGRALVEISRGCPEHCRFCWISYSAGRFHAYPMAALAERIGQLAALGDRIGLVATAVGDHPQLAEILDLCRRQHLDVAVSSLRIPAMKPEVLQPLAESGARSVTIAPEAGNDRLRAAIGKPIRNQQVLAAAATAQECGIDGLKLYFLIGLPGETDDDLLSIAGLIGQVREIMDRFGRQRGRLATLHVGINLLVPKPYTPLHRQLMIDTGEARRRLAIIKKALRKLNNLRLDPPAIREAQWQGFLSRAGTAAFPLIAEAASGKRLGRLLADHRDTIDRVIRHPCDGEAPWHFIATAPV
jgi:radical SAM superfamily enzyme YgiQ (UPF0313 family)